MENFKEIRRKDRILDESRAQELLETAEYGFLSMGESANGYAYGIPINYAYDRQRGILWFHCAPEGHKIENIERNPHLSFCVVGDTAPQPEKFTTLYESVIVFGKATLAANDEERQEALRALIKKYSPGFEESGEFYMSRSLPRTETIKFEIVRMTSKCKR